MAIQATQIILKVMHCRIINDDSDLYLFIALVPNNQNISKLYASGDNPWQVVCFEKYLYSTTYNKVIKFVSFA